MLMTTTNTIEGRRILEYKGLVAGEAILGANLFKDLFASIRDIVGGRSSSYEKVLNDAARRPLPICPTGHRHSEPTPLSVSTSTTRPWVPMAVC